jgi:hypothetical protein
MIRFIITLLVLIIMVPLALLYFAQRMPDWYDANEQQASQHAYQKLINKYQGTSGNKLIEDKVRELLFGELKLSEEELNALIFSTLSNSKDGRRLLAASDGLNAQIKQDTVEFGVILNLDKAAKVDSKMKSYVETLKENLPLIAGEKLYIALESLPTVSNGQLVFDEELKVKLGALSLSKKRLLQLMAKAGVSENKLKELRINVPNVKFNKVAIADSQLNLGLSFR